MAQDFAIDSTATAEFDVPETGQKETVTSEPISVTVEAAGPPVVDTTKQTEIDNKAPSQTLSDGGASPAKAESSINLGELPLSSTFNTTPRDLFFTTPVTAPADTALTPAPAPTLAPAGAAEQPIAWSPMSVPPSGSSAVDVGGVRIDLRASFLPGADSASTATRATTSMAATAVDSAATSVSPSTRTSPAQQFAAQLVATDPLKLTDQVAVTQALGQTGVKVAGKDPLGAFTDPSFGKNNKIAPLNINTMTQVGSESGKAPAPKATSNGALTSQDKALMDRAVESFVVGGNAAANSGKAQINEVNKLQQSQARADQITSNIGDYKNNLKAAQTAFNRAVPEDSTKAAFNNSMMMATPVNIPVGKPKSSITPGGLSDTTMDKIKGTDNPYIAPPPFDPTPGGALTKAATKPVTDGDWAGFLTQPLAGFGLGVLNLPQTIVEGGKSAGNLIQNPPTSESVGAGVGSAAYNAALGLPEQLGKNLALVTGSDPKMVESISQQPSPNNLSGDPGAQRVESALNGAAAALSAGAMARKDLPIATGLAGQAKKTATNPGATTGTGSVKTGETSGSGVLRDLSRAEAQSIRGRGPIPAGNPNNAAGGNVNALDAGGGMPTDLPLTRQQKIGSRLQNDRFNGENIKFQELKDQFEFDENYNPIKEKNPAKGSDLLFPQGVTNLNDVKNLVGGLSDSTISVERSGVDKAAVTIQSKGFTDVQLNVSADAAGRIDRISVGEVTTDGSQPLIGQLLVLKVMKQAEASGVKSVDLHASRLDTANAERLGMSPMQGYRIWPTLGFDGEISLGTVNNFKDALKKEPATASKLNIAIDQIDNTTKLLSVLCDKDGNFIPEAVKAWRSAGGMYHGTVNLDQPGSMSNKVYQKALESFGVK
jgi:hypothetical protein